MKTLLLWFTATLRWFGRLLRRLSRLLYILLVTLIVGVLWLVMTTSGAQWLAEQAMAEEERLELRVTGGSLWNGLEIRQLSWRDEGLDVGVRQAELRWNHLCLMQRRACLDLAAVRGLDVRLDTDALLASEEDEGEPPAEQSDPFPLPIDLSFPDIRIEQVDATVDDHRVRWSELRMGGELTGSTLRVRQFNWETILVELAEQEEELVATAQADDGAPGLLETGWEALDLPEVQLPLNIVVEDLRVHELRVVQGEERYAVQRFSIAGGLRGTDLVLTHLEAVHEHGQLLADGNIKLDNDWPVDLDVHLDARELPEIGDLELRAQLWNSIGDLEFTADARGFAEVHLEGALAPGKQNLPMRLQGNWDALQWPLDTGELVVSRGGKLRLEGDLSDYELAIETDLSGGDIPPGSWELLAHGDLAQVRVERLRGEILEGSLEISGQAAWHPQIAWQADARLKGLAPDTLYAEAPTRVTGGLSTSGQLVDGDLAVNAAIDDLRGWLGEHELRLDGQMERPLGGNWHLRDVRLRSAESILSLDGELSEETLDVAGHIDVTDLNAFMPKLSGTLRGDFVADGPLAKPDIRVDLAGSSLGYGELGSIGELDLAGRVAALGEGSSELTLNLADVDLEAEYIERLSVSLQGDRRAHELALDLNAERLATSLQLDGSLSEDLDWDGALTRGSLSLAGQEWELDQATPIEVATAQGSARIGGHCWRHADASLCAPETIEAGAAGEAQLALRGFELALLEEWLPPEVALEGRMAADVAARWGDSPLPLLTLDTRIDGGSVHLTDPELADDEELGLSLDYERLALQVELDAERLQTTLTLRSETLGAMEIAARTAVTDDMPPFGPLDGEVDITAVRLDVLEPFFHELRTLRGTLSASGRLAGEVTDPRYHGTIELSEGRVEPLAVGIELTDIGLQLEVDGQEAILAGGFNSGDGSAMVSGEANWAGDPTAAVNLSGEGLQVVYDPLADLRVNPDIDVRFGEQKLTVSGRLRVPRGEITLTQLPEGAVQVSDDVVIVGDVPDDVEGVGEDEDEVVAAPGGLDLETDIQLELGDRVDISGYGITGRLTGNLRLRQSGDGVPQGHGEIRIVDGRYRAYGQRLEIRQGQFLFSGPLDRPQLYIEAIRRVERDDVVAGLRLEGNPEQPMVSLFSEPAMAEEDVLSYIVLGRAAGESGPGQENMMARAALALGLAGGGGYAEALADRIGIEDFTLDTEGEGDETQVVMGGYINPNLYVGYGVGVFTPANTLTVRYRLANNLFLEAMTGLESAIDVLYRFEFG